MRHVIAQSFRRYSTPLIAAGLLAAWTLPLTALEISLEENKAERGNIGYVDMQKIFRLYPETHKAKQTYTEIVRQAEEQVNLRRADLLRLRTEMAQLKMERDLLEKSPLPTPIPSQPKPAAPAPAPKKEDAVVPQEASAAQETAMSTSAAAGMPGYTDIATPAEEASVSNATLTDDTTRHAIAESIAHLPGLTPAEKTLEKTDSVTINIPGMETAPGEDVTAPAGDVPSPAAPPTVTPGEDPLQLRARLLQNIDEKIRVTQNTLAAQEADFTQYQASVEKNLIDIESRRTEILLGKIYTAVRDVARENNVSIVVDRNQILYGQSTVDLTLKVLTKLKRMSL